MDTSHSQVLASRWARFAGNLIDSLIVAVVLLPLFFISGGFSASVTGEAVEPTQLQQLTFAVVGLLVYAAVNWKFLSLGGQTIGKKLMNTRIVYMDGNQASPVDVVFRRYAIYMLIPHIPYVGGYISLVGILLIFMAAQRCLHDYVAGTKVVCV